MKIAIYGPMCSGKSTIANIIQKKYPQYKIYSFGQKIKDIANELFNMEGKNRSLLINIADKMRDIDEDVWVKYIMKQINDYEYCIIDDLRFQNELNYLSEWKIIYHLFLYLLYHPNGLVFDITILLYSYIKRKKYNF